MLDSHRFLRLKPLLLFWAVYTILFLVFAATLKYTFPFFLGLLIAILLQPMVRLLQRRLFLPPGAAAALGTFLVYAILFGVLALFGIWLVREVTGMLSYLSAIDWEKTAAPLSSLFQKASEFAGKIDGAFLRQNQDEIIRILQSGAGMLSAFLRAIIGFLTSIPAILTMLLVMICSTYFFARDMRAAAGHLFGFLTKNAAHHLRLASHSGALIGLRYGAAYLFLCFLTFVESLLVFFLFGTPYPLVLSLLAGAADVLPVLGPGLVYLPAAIAMLLCGRPVHAAGLLAGWMVLAVLRQILEPKIVSSSVNVHPLAMLAAIYFFLVSGNLWVLFYFSILFLLYRVLTQTGALPLLFPKQ